MSSGCSRPIHTRRFWAKARPYGQNRPEKIHLLEHHLADVGACFEALLAQPTIRRRLARSGGLDTLGDETAARLALFAAMHDVGKVNVGFQTLVWADGDHPGGRRPGRAGHYNELAPVLANEDHETADWFFDALGWWCDAIESWDDREGETVCGLLVATLSHHGRPLALEDGAPRNTRLWREYGGLRPREQVERIGGLLRRWFPAAFDPGALALPGKPAFQHMFLGLCTWADWIGSNEKWFPFVDEPDDDYFRIAKERASRAIEAIGLDVGGQRSALGAVPDFGRLFGADFSPNAIQRAALEKAPLDTPVVIVESETGSGKTEAALWRFARMYQAGLVDGIYFALPTRAAAKQIHDRVERFVAKLFPNKPPPVVLAVPGYDPGEDAAASAMADYDEGAAGHPARRKAVGRRESQALPGGAGGGGHGGPGDDGRAQGAPLAHAGGLPRAQPAGGGRGSRLGHLHGPRHRGVAGRPHRRGRLRAADVRDARLGGSASVAAPRAGRGPGLATARTGHRHALSRRERRGYRPDRRRPQRPVQARTRRGQPHDGRFRRHRPPRSGGGPRWREGAGGAQHRRLRHIHAGRVGEAGRRRRRRAAVRRQRSNITPSRALRGLRPRHAGRSNRGTAGQGQAGRGPRGGGHADAGAVAGHRRGPADNGPVPGGRAVAAHRKAAPP